MNSRREFGDYQTPEDFALQICLLLKNSRGEEPEIIIEPTCGIGNFLKSCLVFDAAEIYGIEINEHYCDTCREEIKDSRVKIINADFFTFNTRQLIKRNKRVLIIGNPPWVTNSMLSSMASGNLPEKKNFKGLKGYSALTGASNFDICEYIILKLIRELNNTNATIALLCKTTVARNVFRELVRLHIGVQECINIEFDAGRVFSINASACLLIIQMSDRGSTIDKCSVRKFEAPNVVVSTYGYFNGQFYSELNSQSSDFEGSCCFEWRQGIKHDCADVMELERTNSGYVNGRGENVDIEQDLIFPLVKGSMFKRPIIKEFTKYVIVTQRKIKEDTSPIRIQYPSTWRYLDSNRFSFTQRKSSIYSCTPDFSIFGVGDYSFAPYKVGISGFYKKPLFSVLCEENGKPVMVDDTSYFIGFDIFRNAYVAMLYLNSNKVQTYLNSIAFLDSKRPYTKKILARIDFCKILAKVSFEDLVETEGILGLEPNLTNDLITEFLTTIQPKLF